MTFYSCRFLPLIFAFAAQAPAFQHAFAAGIFDTSSPQVSITNKVDHPVIGPGGDLKYTIVVTNIGPVLSDATVTDQSIRESLESCVVSNGDPCTIVFHRFNAIVVLSPLASGESRTISIHANASATAGDYNPISNVAQVSVGPSGNVIASASAPVVARETADISIATSLADNASGLMHFVHTVRNLGPNNAHAVELVDPLPAGTEFISASTTLGSCGFHSTLGPRGTVLCPLRNTTADTAVQVDLVLQAINGSCPAVSNTASIVSQSIDPESGNDSSTLLVPVPASICTLQAPPAYQVSFFPYSDVRWGARYLNNNGDLLGFVPEYQTAINSSFFYKNGASEPVVLTFDATGFNDLGDVVGLTYNGNRTYQGDLYKDDRLTSLNFGPQYPQGVPSAINNSGQIAGANPFSLGPADAFFYQGGIAQDIGHLPGYVTSSPTAINNKGEISGKSSQTTTTDSRAFLYTNGLMLNASPPLATYSYANGLNASGMVPGFFTARNPSLGNGFIYQGGKFTYLSYGAVPVAINDCGDAVGTGPNLSFLYKQGVYIDLNRVPGLPTFFNPIAINNRGQILGSTGGTMSVGPGVALLTPTVLEKCGSDATIDNSPNSPQVAAGGTIVYTIKAVNLDSATSQFTVTDDLDPTTTVSGCTVDGGGGICTVGPGTHTVSVNLPDLTKGSAATLTIQAKTGSTYPAHSVIMNTATLSSSTTSDYLSTAYTSTP